MITKLSKEYREKFVFIVNTDTKPKFYTKDVFLSLIKKIRDNFEDFNINKKELNDFLNTKVSDGFVDKDGYLI
jgi:hypothetical protein